MQRGYSSLGKHLHARILIFILLKKTTIAMASKKKTHHKKKANKKILLTLKKLMNQISSYQMRNHFPDKKKELVFLKDHFKLKI